MTFALGILFDNSRYGKSWTASNQPAFHSEISQDCEKSCPRHLSILFPFSSPPPPPPPLWNHVVHRQGKFIRRDFDARQNRPSRAHETSEPEFNDGLWSKLDFWKWVGPKNGIQSASSHKMLFFLQLESTFHPLDAPFHTLKKKEYSSFFLNSSPPAAEIRSLTRDRLRWIDAWSPYKFKNSGSEFGTWSLFNNSCFGIEGVGGCCNVQYFVCKLSLH
jgi:hypothetical protein